jgi:hypothetical protein
MSGAPSPLHLSLINEHSNIIDLSPEDIAKWPKPNYVNPHERNGMIPIQFVWFSVATLVVASRLGLRLTGKLLGADDILLAVAWPVSLMFTITGYLVSERTLAKRHMWDIPPKRYEEMALLVWLGEFSYLISGCCCKISVLLSYRHLTAGTYNRYMVLPPCFLPIVG